MEKDILMKICNKNKLSIIEKLEELGNCNTLQLSKLLNIDYKNITRYINQLKNDEVIKIINKGKGKPKIISLK